MRRPSPRSAALHVAVVTAASAAAICTLPAPATAAALPSNLARTRAELQRLEADVRLPASSERRSPVHRLSSPADVPDAGRSLEDRTRYYTVHLRLNRVLRWARAHPPRGLRYSYSGTSGSNGRPPSEVFAGFTGRDTGAYLEPTVEYSVVRGAPGHTLWRVDEIALWLDARPIVDRPGTAPLRVTHTSGCPASDRGSFDVRNPGTGLAHHLVPAPAPTTVLVCRYAGMNGRAPFSLIDSASAGARRAGGLAAAARRISLAHLVGGETSCPNDIGEATVVDFSYASRPDVDLWYARTGCPRIRNGHTVSGDAPDRTGFYAQLRHLS